MNKIARLVLVSVLAASVTGCGCFFRRHDPHVPPVIPEGNEPVRIDKDLLKACEPLPALQGNTESDVASLTKSWSELYATCALNHKKLSDLTIKAWNVKTDSASLK